MIEILFAVALLMIDVVLVLMAIMIKRLSKEICEIEVKLEHIRKHLDFYQLSDHESRLDQLEEVLELKEWFDNEDGMFYASVEECNEGILGGFPLHRLTEYEDEKCEIVGNIYDNPELKKKYKEISETENPNSNE